MDDYGEKQQPREERPRRRGWRRFGIFLGILLAVLGVVVLAAYRDGTGFDALRRYFAYGAAKGEEESGFSYDAAENNRFAALGEGLVVLSGSELRVEDGKGNTVCSIDVSMESPALCAGGGRVAAWDVGGTELYVVDEKGELLHLSAARTEPLISASLNHAGWLAVTAEEQGYKGCVSVYNGAMKLLFAFHSDDRFVTGAWVDDKCKTLAAVTLGQKDSVFLSDIVLYDLKETEPRASAAVSDALVVALGEQDGKLAAVGDTALAFAEYSGALGGSYSYRGAYLREYTLGGDGFAALVLNRYSSGNVGRLVSVAPDGTELAARDAREEILSLSAAGRYLAVLSAEKLTIYDSLLREYGATEDVGDAKSVLMRADGSALLLGEDRAQVFLP